jgi:hypothetical protein
LTSGIDAGNGIFGGGSSFSTVPEPASVLLAVMAFGSLALAARSRRHDKCRHA